MRGIVVALAMAVVAACASPARSAADEAPPQRAFYYWRTTFRLAPAEQRAIEALGVARLYLRVFDVDWAPEDPAPSLIGKVAPGEGARVPAGVEVVPVVFIREAVLRGAGRATAGLAKELWAEVRRRAELIGFAPRELQLDCDWTDTTRDAFFALVAQVRAEAKLPLSATIRLHQIKYRERTGVPPVERGMLMYYNMGTFSADPEARAIFDAASAARYLARIADYPLPLDVALPIWSWILHVRDDAVQGLMQSTDPDELAALPFLARAGADRYVAVRSAFLHGTLLREGDVLKLEITGPAEARAAAEQVAPHLARGARRTVSLFDLSERNLTRHDTATLDQLFRTIR